MIILGVILIILIALTDLVIYKNLFSPVVMFNLLFALIIILALQRKYGIGTFDNRAVFFIEFGVIFFDMGVSMLRLILRSSTRLRQQETKLDFRWGAIVPLTLVVTAGNVFTFFYAMLFLINGGNYVQLRNALLGYGDSVNFNIINPVVGIISSYVSAPGLYALLPIAILLFIKRKYKWFSVLIFVNLLLNILSSGSRIILVYTSVQFIIAMVYEGVRVSKKAKKVVLALVGIALTIIIILSSLRSSNSIFRSFYAYFSAPVVLFSYWMNYVDQSNIQSYGLSFFYPVTWLINAGGNLVGVNFESIKNVVEWQSLPQDVWVNVFPMQSMNAFSTLFYFFYEDFRAVGVCVGSFIFGSVSGSVFYQAFIRKDTKYLVVYLLGVKALLGSFMIWQLGSTSFFLSLILLLVCVKKSKAQNVEYKY